MAEGGGPRRAAPMDERNRRPLSGQGPRRRCTPRDGRRQAVGFYPVRHRRHRRSGTGRGSGYGAVPDLRAGHADARGASYRRIRCSAAPSGQTAEGSGKLAGAAQSSDSDNRVTNFWGVVLLEGRHRIDRLTQAIQRKLIHRTSEKWNSRKCTVTSGRRYGFQGCRSLCTLAPPARFKAKLIAFVARNCYKPLRLATAQLT